MEPLVKPVKPLSELHYEELDTFMRKFEVHIAELDSQYKKFSTEFAMQFATQYWEKKKENIYMKEEPTKVMAKSSKLLDDNDLVHEWVIALIVKYIDEKKLPSSLNVFSSWYEKKQKEYLLEVSGEEGYRSLSIRKR